MAEFGRKMPKSKAWNVSETYKLPLTVGKVRYDWICLTSGITNRGRVRTEDAKKQGLERE